jgi:hypothetical protein
MEKARIRKALSAQKKMNREGLSNYTLRDRICRQNHINYKNCNKKFEKKFPGPSS